MSRFVDVDAFKEWLLENSINEREVEESKQIGIWIDAFCSMQNEQSDCEDCIKHGGDWECNRIRCHKGDVPDINVGELISRQDAIDAIKELCEHYTPTKSVDHPHMNFVIEELQKLPYVQPTPQTPSNVLNSLDCVDRAEAIKAVKFYETFCDPYPRVIEALEGLPSVQPDKDLIHLQKEQSYMQGYEDGRKPRKGKWKIYATFDDCYYAKCNQCHETQVFYYNKPLTNFCPNCGADMRESKKPKSCFECEYSSEIDEDTVLCTEIKTMMSTSQNRNNIPPFCPKYLD